MCDRLYMWDVLLSGKKSGLICGYSEDAVKELAAINLGFDSITQYINSFPDKDVRDHDKMLDIEDVCDGTGLEYITKEIFKTCEIEGCTDVVMMPSVRDALESLRRTFKTYYSAARTFYLCKDWMG